ncbi:hypothetical protein HQO44_07605 [Rhodococcus fascians]|nr:hypothetical protein [Rhodococcus fascians]
MTLIGLDGAEQDFAVATWLCMDVLDRFASAGDTVGYWVQRMIADHSSSTEQQLAPSTGERADLSVVV